MKFRLIEKTDQGEFAITYEVTQTDGETMVHMMRSADMKLKPLLIATGITETKRGWSFETYLLTSKPITIFLPRANFRMELIEPKK